MKIRLIKNKTYNLFILSIIILLGFSFFYFLYYRQRNSTEIYVSLLLARSSTSQLGAIPYWVANAIDIEDKETSPLGGVNAKVLDKEAFDGNSLNQFVNLIVKLKAIRDKSGIYLFKNKPVLVGSVLELRLPKTQAQGIVTYIGNKPPSYQYLPLIVTAKISRVDKEVADTVDLSSKIVNNKGQVIAKIIDKKVIPNREVLADRYSSLELIYDENKYDLVITVELLAKRINDVFYFAETQKVKVGELLYIPLKEAALSSTIISVKTLESSS